MESSELVFRGFSFRQWQPPNQLLVVLKQTIVGDRREISYFCFLSLIQDGAELDLLRVPRIEGRSMWRHQGCSLNPNRPCLLALQSTFA